MLPLYTLLRHEKKQSVIDRGFLTPYFIKALSILPTPPPTSPHLKFAQLSFPILSIIQPSPLFCSFISLTEWVIGPYLTCFILLNDMDLHKSSSGTLYHKDLALCFMQGVSLLRSNAWSGFLLALWFDITQPQTKTSHAGANKHAPV